MSIEQVLEMAFLQEVKKAGQLWVAKSGMMKVYSEEFGRTGFSIPVWSNRERAADYLTNARLVGAKYEPVAVALDDFTNRWLSDKMMDITEVQLNPNGVSQKVLVVTPDEFKTDASSSPGPPDQ